MGNFIKPQMTIYLTFLVWFFASTAIGHVPGLAASMTSKYNLMGLKNGPFVVDSSIKDEMFVNMTQGVSVSFWMRTYDDTDANNDQMATQCPFMIQNFDNANLFQPLWGRGKGGFVMGGSSEYQKSTAYVAADNSNWHHLTIIWNQATGLHEVYRDGLEAHSLTVGVGYDSYKDGLVLTFGHNTYNWWKKETQVSDLHSFVGELDEFALWNRVLGASEVSSLYSNGGAPTSDLQTGLILHFDFNDPVTENIRGVNATVVKNLAQISSSSDWDLVMGYVATDPARSDLDPWKFQFSTSEELHQGVAPVLLPSTVPSGGSFVTKTNTQPTAYSYTQNLIEDEENVLVYCRGKDDENMNPLVYTVSKLPAKGKLFQVTSDVKKSTEITATGTVISNIGLRVIYLPDQDGSGLPYDSFEYSIQDGTLTSDPGIVTLMVKPLDDIPAVASSSYNMVEDGSSTSPQNDEFPDVNAKLIDLTATDAEGDTLAVYINTLPSKGKLYLTKDGEIHTKADSNGNLVLDMTKHTLIDREFSPYDVRKPIEQWATGVANVSSYWDFPPDTDYSPYGALGQPTCSQKGECGDDRPWTRKESAVPLGINTYTWKASADRNMPATIIAVHSASDPTDYESYTYDVQYLTYYKEVGSELKKCFMTGATYPDNCDPDAYTSTGDIRTNVPLSEIKPEGAGVWCPAKKGLVQGAVASAKSVALGAGYKYNHDNSAPYNAYGYTEYIEVTYDTPIYVLGFEVHSPRGYGSVVNVQAKNQDTGDFSRVYRGDALIDEAKEYSDNGWYHIFSPKVCRPPFLTNHIRFEVDTSADTGIDDWNYIDAILLSGAEESQPSVLYEGNHKVVYVADAHASGEDSFTYTANDCFYDKFRSAKPETISLSIAAVDDKPIARDISVEAQQYLGSEIKLEYMEFDNQDVEFVVKSIPSGVELFYDASGDVLTTVSEKIATVNNDLTYTYVPTTGMTKVQINTAFTNTKLAVLVSGDCLKDYEIKYEVRDSSSSSNEATITVSVPLCLPPPEATIVIKPYEVSDSTYMVGAILAGIGSALCASFLVYNITKRNMKYIRMSTPSMNNLMLIGVLIGLVNIFLMKFSDTDPDAFQFNCILTLCLGSLSFSLAFGSLSVKTFRAYKIFNNPKLQKLTIKESQLMAGVAGMVLIDVIILVAWIVADPIKLTIKEFSMDTTGSGNPTATWDPVDMSFTAAEHWQPVLYRCASPNDSIWKVMLYAYKGFVLMAATFLAFGTRKVNIPAINDSKQIGMSIYTTCILMVILLPVSFIMSDRPDALFFLTSVGSWLVGTTMICFIFVPKIMAISSGTADELTMRSTTVQSSNTGASSNDK